VERQGNISWEDRRVFYGKANKRVFHGKVREYFIGRQLKRYFIRRVGFHITRTYRHKPPSREKENVGIYNPNPSVLSARQGKRR
jgi:hypothetical protein